MTTQPVKKFRAGAITATIWNNETEKEGQTVTYPSIAIERSYKDTNNQWQTTSSMRTMDLPKAALVLSKAYEFLSLEAEV